jgi:hypothetical protein
MLAVTAHLPQDYFLLPATTMFSRSIGLLVSLGVVLHSGVAHAAPDPLITAAPTPTTPERRQEAGGPGTPILSTLHFAFTDLPFQVYPFPVLRGPQFGFNICNSTTLGNNSNCQTLIFNGPVRFNCLYRL